VDRPRGLHGLVLGNERGVGVAVPDLGGTLAPGRSGTLEELGVNVVGVGLDEVDERVDEGVGEVVGLEAEWRPTKWCNFRAARTLEGRDSGRLLACH